MSALCIIYDRKIAHDEWAEEYYEVFDTLDEARHIWAQFSDGAADGEYTNVRIARIIGPIDSVTEGECDP